MKIALIQLNSEWEDKQANYKRAAVHIERAADTSCHAAVLPEMFSTGFSMNVNRIAEEEQGETAAFLSAIAKKTGIHVIAGYSARSPGRSKGRNLAVVMDPAGRMAAKYDKIHPFSYLKEDQFYVPGERPVTFEIHGMPSSLFICYDLRFPEIFRMVAKKIQAVFILANWPAVREEHWVSLLKARAIENQCFVIAVNRTGQDGNGIVYSGASQIIDPLGQTVCSGNGETEFITGEVQPEKVEALRSEFPFLQDMRPWSLH